MAERAILVPLAGTPVAGKKVITANGAGIDVRQYAEVDVAVPQGGGETVPVSIEVQKTWAEFQAMMAAGSWKAGQVYDVEL